MRFTRRAALAAAALLLATMTACGSGSGGSDDQTIRILGFQPIPEEILTGFTQETGITVELDRQGGGDFPQILQSRVSAKSDIDILNVRGGAEFNRYATAGTFADLTGEAFLDRVSDVGLAPGLIDGKNYGYSQTSYVTGVFYNKDLFAELGLEVPGNWDELMAAAEKVKAAGVSPFVFTAGEAWTNQYFYHNAVALYAEANPEFMARLSTGEATWMDNDLFTRQIKRFEEIVQRDLLIPGAQSMQGQEGQAMFAAGEAAMYLMGSWTLSSLEPQGFELGMFAVPINAPGEPAARASSLSDNMYTVTSWSTKQDAAKRFLDYLTRPEVATVYAEANKNASTIEGVDAQFSQFQADVDRLMQEAVLYPGNIGPSVNGSGPNLLGDIVAGAATADEVIAGFQALQEEDNATDYFVDNR
jgi:raffinose/stachyose/melibiose transport system substrate-binding protein